MNGQSGGSDRYTVLYVANITFAESITKLHYPGLKDYLPNVTTTMQMSSSSLASKVSVIDSACFLLVIKDPLHII